MYGSYSIKLKQNKAVRDCCPTTTTYCGKVCCQEKKSYCYKEVVQCSYSTTITCCPQRTKCCPPVVNVTYDELVNLINTTSLVTNSTYLITDYQLITDGITYGPIEPIYVTATSSTTLSEYATSSLYPDDTIIYDVNHLINQKGTILSREY